MSPSPMVERHKNLILTIFGKVRLSTGDPTLVRTTFQDVFTIPVHATGLQTYCLKPDSGLGPGTAAHLECV